jgi:pyrimidine deaminase RibD-like protein
LNYLLWCIKTAQADEFNVDNPVIGEEYMLDSEDRSVTKVRPPSIAAKQRASISNIDDVANYLVQEEPSTGFNFETADQVEIGGRYFDSLTAPEIYKFHIVAGDLRTPAIKRKRVLPEVQVVHKPIRKLVTESIKAELLGTTSSTKFHRTRLHYLRFADARRWMELAVCEMRRSKEKMMLYLERKKAALPNFNSEDFTSRIPLLSAIAVDANGDLVATCFKGQIDDPEDIDKAWRKHCEFSLFEEVIKDKDMPLLKGGTLFVTLEPCNKRGFYLDGSVGKPKIPCAVRCVEAGIKRIYIGALDFNKRVYKKGKAILETGEYPFRPEESKRGDTSSLLESYFNWKGYSAVPSGGVRAYKIGKPVEVFRFDDDLIEEICGLNSAFLRAHEQRAFR